MLTILVRVLAYMHFIIMQGCTNKEANRVWCSTYLSEYVMYVWYHPSRVPACGNHHNHLSYRHGADLLHALAMLAGCKCWPQRIAHETIITLYTSACRSAPWARQTLSSCDAESL